MNLVTAFKEEAGVFVPGAVSQLIDIPRSQAEVWMNALLPLMMTGIIDRVQDSSGAKALLQFVLTNNLRYETHELKRLFLERPEVNRIMESGRLATRYIFHEKRDAVISQLNESAGLSLSRTAASLDVFASLFLSFITQERFADMSDPQSFCDLIQSQKQYIKAPANMDTGLKIEEDQTEGQIVESYRSAGGASRILTISEQPNNTQKKGMKRLLPWILLLVGSITLLWILRNCTA